VPPVAPPAQPPTLPVTGVDAEGGLIVLAALLMSGLIFILLGWHPRRRFGGGRSK
jgi:LPXTG-motif cell wall-anchored protein